MTLIPRFLKPTPPPPPTLDERIAALASATPEVLASTAEDADEDALRIAAIARLEDGATLRRLAHLAPAAESAVATPAAIRQAAQSRIAHLIDQGALAAAEFLAEPDRSPERLAILGLCADAGRLEQAIDAIGAPAELAEIAEHSPSSRARQLAATRLEDPAQLKALIKQLRGKDKTVYRIIKQKCDAIAAEAHKLEDAAREALAVCVALERHVTAQHDVVYAPTLVHLANRWRTLEPRPDAELEARATLAIGRCQAILDAEAEEIARRNAEEQARELAAVAALEDRQRAEQAAEQAARERADRDAEAAAEAATAREAESRVEGEKHDADEEFQRQVGGLIRMARDVLRAGNTRKAARLRLSIDEKLAGPQALPAHLSRLLQQLDDQLNELRHWKDYAVAPKRMELIEEMESLVGSDEEPAALAERIRALQQEWRTINKGIVSGAPQEAERFQKAQQAAFKPCQEYFAAQAKLRQENLEARRSIVNRLLALEASQQDEHQDRRLILQALREAPREFWKPSPVEREAGRALHAEFDAVMDRLRALLDASHAANAAERQALIAEAQALLALDDTMRAIDAAKGLQARWKVAGALPRDQDQALWAEFRGVCDAIYKRRDDANAQFAAGLEAARAQALALCEEIEAAVASDESSRAEGAARAAGWRAASDAVGELPRGDARVLRERFENAIGRFEARLSDHDRRAAAASATNLFDAVRHVRAYERAVDGGHDERDALKAAAEQFIGGVARWPKGGQQSVRQALARADAATDTDAAARERALRILCIRAELLGSSTTPAEDEALRREYQVERLRTSLGQGTHADDRDWDALVLEWIATRAIAADLHDRLEQRFQAALARRPKAVAERSPYARHDGGDGRRDRRDRDDRGPRRDDRGAPRAAPRSGPRR
jgi:hypothetical protein